MFKIDIIKYVYRLTILTFYVILESLFVSNTLADTTWLFNAEKSEKYRILFDYYHHLKPTNRVGDYLITGGYTNNVGRYGWDDYSHTNSYDPVFTAIDSEFNILIHESPFSDNILENVDGVVIVNPDDPALTHAVPLINDKEIEVLKNYVKKGGSLLILINSGGHPTESFESVQLRKLVRSFGLDWNVDNTKYSDIELGMKHPYFYDTPVFHYGAGCTLRILENAIEPTILMEVYSNKNYRDISVKGPGIVMTRYGLGKFILVGDSGSWGANISRPWAENKRVLVQLFNYLKPDVGVNVPVFNEEEELQYKITVAQMSKVSANNSLVNISRPLHKIYSPRPKLYIPYLEATGELTVRVIKKSENKATQLNVILDNFGYFKDIARIEGKEKIFLTASRQGNVSEVEAFGDNALWLAPDVHSLVAMIPGDWIRPGDSWNKNYNLRIPTIKGSDLSTTKKVGLEVTYIRDEKVNGIQCRLLQANREIWLDEIDVSVEDVLPEDEVRRWGGSHYELMSGRGGSLLVKQQQWIDMNTGRVVKAKTQSRIVAWIQDLERPIGLNNAEIDSDMIISLSHMITFDLNR